MNQTIRDIMQDCTRASDEERVTFGEVIGKLMEAGVERYHADLVTATRTYYLPSGEVDIVPAHPAIRPASPDFSPASVEAAIRAVQSQTIRYREFCERIMAAGCVGYIVSLAGRRAVYYGRSGETHVEAFPPAR